MSTLNASIEDQKCSAVLYCSINIFHIWRPPCVSIGYVRLFARISPPPALAPVSVPQYLLSPSR